MTRKPSNLTPQAALLKLTRKRPHKTLRQIAKDLRPEKPFNVGELSGVINGKRDASNALRAALGCHLKPTAAQPCEYIDPQTGRMCGQHHADQKFHQRAKRKAKHPKVYRSLFEMPVAMLARAMRERTEYRP